MGVRSRSFLRTRACTYKKKEVCAEGVARGGILPGRQPVLSNPKTLNPKLLGLAALVRQQRFCIRRVTSWCFLCCCCSSSFFSFRCC